MRYRDKRYACNFVTRFKVAGTSCGGTIHEVSRSGLRAFLGTHIRRGALVSFRLAASERTARVVRVDGQGDAGLKLDRPLTQAEFDEISVGFLRGGHRRPQQFTESR